MESCCFLNKIFLNVLFCSFCIFFIFFFGWLSLYAPIVEIHREWYVIFRVLRDVLFLNLRSIPMAWFSFVVTWFICFNHSKWLPKRTPRYFTVLVGVKCFPSSLNLRLWSIFFELEWKMINSVLVKLRDSLLAFSHWDSFQSSV